MPLRKLKCWLWLLHVCTGIQVRLKEQSLSLPTETILKNCIRQIMTQRIGQINNKPKSAICLIFLLPLLLLGSCREKETWLSCTENGDRIAGDQKASFYIKIVRKNDGIQTDYIDAFNSASVPAKETPIAINFAANIHIHPTLKRKEIIQAFYSIDKQTLKFSKTIRHFDSRSSSSSGEYTGGISIQNAGICNKLNSKPQSLI